MLLHDSSCARRLALEQAVALTVRVSSTTHATIALPADLPAGAGLGYIGEGGLLDCQRADGGAALIDLLVKSGIVLFR